MNADITPRNVELERMDARREALEQAAKRVEGHNVTGETYRKALKLAARLIRELKFAD